jgi:hypothetical protein
MKDHADPERIAKNEDLRRDENERIEAHYASIHWVDPPYADWVCECANESCREPVRLTVAEYDEVRLNPTHFMVVPSEEHVRDDIERVVSRNDRYWVVEKLGVAAEVSERTDDREAGEAAR